MALALVSLVAVAAPAGAQGIALELLTDIETWKTDDSSRLLARNDGRAVLAGRMQAFFTARLRESLDLRSLGRVEANSASGDDEHASLDMLSLRYGRSRALVVEAGKQLYPMGSFGARRFSNVNPLIGAPDLYPTQYPLAIAFFGAAGVVDYRAALVSLPLVNTRYTPRPGKKGRPVVGIGMSAGPSFRIGASATRGPYLSEREADQLPAGPAWDDFSQTIVAADARYSIGYFETRAEAAWSRYEVPTVSKPVKGFGWYGEVRATISPRVFVAARYEDFNYPFILPISPSFWVGTATRQMNGEIGAGYRFNADALIKTSFRKDRWPVQTNASGMRFPNGYAVAVQFSHSVDVMRLLEGKY